MLAMEALGGIGSYTWDGWMDSDTFSSLSGGLARDGAPVVSIAPILSFFEASLLLFANTPRSLLLCMDAILEDTRCQGTVGGCGVL